MTSYDHSGLVGLRRADAETMERLKETCVRHGYPAPRADLTQREATDALDALRKRAIDRLKGRPHAAS